MKPITIPNKIENMDRSDRRATVAEGSTEIKIEIFLNMGRKYIRNPKNGPKKKFLNHNDLFTVYTGV